MKVVPLVSEIVRVSPPPTTQFAGTPASSTTTAPTGRPGTARVALAPTACSALFTRTTYPSGSGRAPRVVVTTRIVPDGGPHMTSRSTWTVSDATVTSFGLSPATAQLGAQPLNPTACVPAATFAKVSVPLLATGTPASSSRSTRYPSGSGLSPLVMTETSRLPGGVPHLTSKSVRTTLPAFAVTLREM